jgi:hypothetical protein
MATEYWMVRYWPPSIPGIPDCRAWPTWLYLQAKVGWTSERIRGQRFETREEAFEAKCEGARVVHVRIRSPSERLYLAQRVKELEAERERLIAGWDKCTSEFWEASNTILSANAAMLSGGAPMPEWAARATEAGWRAPKGWKP